MKEVKASSGQLAVARTTNGHRVKLYGCTFTVGRMLTRVAYISGCFTLLLNLSRKKGNVSAFCYGTNVPGFMDFIPW